MIYKDFVTVTSGSERANLHNADIVFRENTISFIKTGRGHKWNVTSYELEPGQSWASNYLIYRILKRPDIVVPYHNYTIGHIKEIKYNFHLLLPKLWEEVDRCFGHMEDIKNCTGTFGAMMDDDKIRWLPNKWDGTYIDEDIRRSLGLWDDQFVYAFSSDDFFYHEFP